MKLLFKDSFLLPYRILFQMMNKNFWFASSTRPLRNKYLRMNNYFGRLVVCTSFLLMAAFSSNAQVNAVQFGKNRVQYQKFNWKYYQTENFNTYFSQDGLELGKYVAQIAEAELKSVEEFVEFGLQRRANVAVYNNFD